MSGARVRRTRAEDFAQINALFKEAKIVFTGFNAKTFPRFLERNRKFCFVACKGQRVVGNIFGEFNGVSYGYVSKLAVSKDSRREGIATMLLERLLSELKKVGAVWAYCIVDRHNAESFKTLRVVGMEKSTWGVLVEKYPL